jgi:hypothetical protein
VVLVALGNGESYQIQHIQFITFAPTELKVQLTSRPVSSGQKGRSQRTTSTHDAGSVALIGSSRHPGSDASLPLAEAFPIKCAHSTIALCAS